MITVLNEQVKTLQRQVEADFGRHPDAEIYLSQPGLGPVSAPGSSASSATTRTATPAARPARTTPAPAPSPVPPERGRSSPPGSSATTGSPTRSWPRPSTPSALTWRPRPLRRRARPRHRAQPRPAQTRQPACRHPARMPQDPHPLRRGNRLAAPGKDTLNLTSPLDT